MLPDCRALEKHVTKSKAIVSKLKEAKEARENGPLAALAAPNGVGAPPPVVQRAATLRPVCPSATSLMDGDLLRDLLFALT